MPAPFLQSVRSVLRFILSLVFTIFLGLLAWLFFRQYKDEVLYSKVRTEGQPITLRISAVSRERKEWRDYLGNWTYIHFTYEQKPYTVRYRDSSWTSAGDNARLFYHAGLDLFRQSQPKSGFGDNKDRSALINYSAIRSWNDERKWLILWVSFTGVFAIFLCGMLATISKLDIIRIIGQFIFGAMLLLGAFYLTINAWQYYRYYNRLKSEGQPTTVIVESTSRHSTSQRYNWFYRYEADVRQGDRRRIIAIEEEEYDTVNPGDALPVLYHKELDDLMSTHYKAGYSDLVAALFIWLLTFILGRDVIRKLRRKR